MRVVQRCIVHDPHRLHQAFGRAMTATPAAGLLRARDQRGGSHRRPAAPTKTEPARNTSPSAAKPSTSVGGEARHRGLKLLAPANACASAIVRCVSHADLSDEKHAIRERIWTLLEDEGAARFPGTRGRIPNFKGAEAAAERLAGTATWGRAATVKANPDAPQLPVRARALAEGKRVYMAVPKLAAKRPFLLLDPEQLGTQPRRAASIKGASRYGTPVSVEDVEAIDLIVCGSVAVNRKGVRVGKGGGFSDLEFALLGESGSIDDRTEIVTTVHPLQVLDEDLPETEHDFRAGRIVTPDDVYACASSRRRPPGVLWSHLDPAKIESIPALAALARG